MYKAILVDDEILVREAISENINWNSLGYELVGVCENGKEAIEFIENTPVDLVLTDIYMPHIDGMGLSKYIYEHCPNTKVIIFSGYSDFEYTKQAIKYNVSEYILKPVTAMELSESLTKLKGELDKEREENERFEELEVGYRTYIKNKSFIVSKAILNLIKGTKDTKDSKKELQELGITLTGMYWRVVVIDIDIYLDYCDIEFEVKRESALMSFVVENISDEILRKYDCGRAYTDNEHRIFLLLHTNKPMEFLNKAVEICTEIQESVMQAMKLSISLGLGKYVNDLDDLHESYESAVQILQYCYTKGRGVLLNCEEQSLLEEQIEWEEEQVELAEAVKEANFEKTGKVLDYIYDKIKALYITRNQSIFYMNETIRLVKRVTENAGCELTCFNQTVADVIRAKNFDEAFAVVRKCVIASIQNMQENMQSSSERQAIKAITYLKENYSDSELSLNSVCSYLNVSVSHFSNVFKEITGETFLEMLTKIRMEKAKQFLRETNLKNYEIAEKVGFSDPHYFSVAFKKNTGKTPKEYAKEYQKNGEKEKMEFS